MENLKTANIKELTVAHLLPVIQSCYENMTAEQCRSMKSGKPDIATKSLLAEATIEIIEIASKHFLMMAQNANIEVSEEAFLDNIGTILPEPLAEALTMDGQGHKVSTKEQLFAKEVVRGVQSAQSADTKTNLSSESERIVPPKRLNNMISRFGERMMHASFLMWEHLGMSIDTISYTEPEVETESVDSQDVPKEQLDREHEKLRVGSQDSFNTSTLKTAIEKAVAQFSPVVDQTKEYNKPQSVISEESQLFAKELTGSLQAEIEDSPESDEVITPTTFKEKLKQSLKNHSLNIKSFLVTQFAKATILRAVKNVRAAFQRTGKDESSESVEQLVRDVDFLLQTVKDLSKNETCELELFTDIAIGKRKEFTKQLTEMLDHHASQGVAPEILPDHFRRAYINRKVRVFLALMRWWLFTQAESQSQSVMLAILDAVTEPQSSVPTSHPKPDYIVPDASARKAYIKIILHKLFSRIAKKLNITCTCGCSENIHSWLLEEVWDQLQDKELIITPQNLKNLEKRILKDLRDVFGSVENVQVALELQKSIAVKLIAYSLTEHLSQPKETPSAIVRFFTTLAKAITWPFKRTT